MAPCKDTATTYSRLKLGELLIRSAGKLTFIVLLLLDVLSLCFLVCWD